MSFTENPALDRKTTLCDISGKHFIEWKYPPCIFALLKGIDNHDISIFSYVVHSSLPIWLPG